MHTVTQTLHLNPNSKLPKTLHPKSTINQQSRMWNQISRVCHQKSLLMSVCIQADTHRHVSVDMCCSAVAACCSVLQCVAVCCSVLMEKVMVNSLQCVCVLQCCQTSISRHVLRCCCSVLQRVAACCSVLQCVAVC